MVCLSKSLDTTAGWIFIRVSRYRIQCAPAFRFPATHQASFIKIFSSLDVRCLMNCHRRQVTFVPLISIAENSNGYFMSFRSQANTGPTPGVPMRDRLTVGLTAGQEWRL